MKEKFRELLKRLVQTLGPLLYKLSHGSYRLLKGGMWILEKLLAIFILCHMWLLKSLSTKGGIALLVFIVCLGVVGVKEDAEKSLYFTNFEIYCICFVAYVYFTLLVLYILLRIPQVEKWLFKQLGEETVRKLVYSSPPLASIAHRLIASVTASAVIVGFGHGIITERVENNASADYKENVRLTNEWKRDQKEAIDRRARERHQATAALRPRWWEFWRTPMSQYQQIENERSLGWAQTNAEVHRRMVAAEVEKMRRQTGVTGRLFDTIRDGITFALGGKSSEVGIIVQRHPPEQGGMLSTRPPTALEAGVMISRSVADVANADATAAYLANIAANRTGPGPTGLPISTLVPDSSTQQALTAGRIPVRDPDYQGQRLIIPGEPPLEARGGLAAHGVLWIEEAEGNDEEE